MAGRDWAGTQSSSSFQNLINMHGSGAPDYPDYPPVRGGQLDPHQVPSCLADRHYELSVCVCVCAGGNPPPPLFLRTEQFNLKLELFLAIHQRMEVAFNSRAFIVVPICATH